tara:strand:+ start:4973 stop:5149 length:177 start_codon:yes stop_codon:yes gene_type:complete
MTRKHYKIIAEAMAESKPKEYDDIVVWKATVETLAIRLGNSNSNFDKDKFLDACNYYK